ncbi:MAG: hypothetical protein RIE52_05430 [Balneola sp.]
MCSFPVFSQNGFDSNIWGAEYDAIKKDLNASGQNVQEAESEVFTYLIVTKRSGIQQYENSYVFLDNKLRSWDSKAILSVNALESESERKNATDEYFNLIEMLIKENNSNHGEPQIYTIDSATEKLEVGRLKSNAEIINGEIKWRYEWVFKDKRTKIVLYSYGSTKGLHLDFDYSDVRLNSFLLNPSN